MDILFGINDYVIKLTFTKLKEVISKAPLDKFQDLES